MGLLCFIYSIASLKTNVVLMLTFLLLGSYAGMYLWDIFQGCRWIRCHKTYDSGRCSWLHCLHPWLVSAVGANLVFSYIPS
ncbi:uncharacterized protein A1O9_11698 [Exophiala aquamarina CBS 119918]|uniref:Uncharacterized protein n=1 Tax=Exophiala aquamarina CBS 119918 TaxID=1182545 RepID=A0A072NYG8_9EURO|nr:uncharacterized protein A1O9_11698 [Exophiala aquamarina CBS 119918]KEF52457.1 hypothetical protein A1O9_11698 [Exophiala aquamarina CBS 119918]